MKTLNLFLMAATLVSATGAFAAVCETEDGVVRVRANDSVLVISDTTVGAGNKTIARFTAEKTLDIMGARDGGTVYRGNVDLRFNDSARKGELILGTKLGELDEIQVYVGDMDDESEVPGAITLIKRNGEKHKFA